MNRVYPKILRNRPFEALFVRKNIEDCFVRIAGRTRVGIKISGITGNYSNAVVNFVVVPQRLENQYPKRQKTDRLDARAMSNKYTHLPLTRM